MTFSTEEVKRITPLLLPGEFRIVTKLVLKKKDTVFSMEDITVILFWEWLIHLGCFTDSSRRYMAERLKPTFESVSRAFRSEQHLQHQELARFPICIIDGQYLAVPEYRACYDILEEKELPMDADRVHAALATTIIQCNIQNLLRARWAKLLKLRELHESKEKCQNTHSGDAAK